MTAHVFTAERITDALGNGPSVGTRYSRSRGFLKRPQELAIADQSMRATHVARVAVVTQGPPPLVHSVSPADPRRRSGLAVEAVCGLSRFEYDVLMQARAVGRCESARDLAGDRPPTDDDVSITRDGRRLDTPDKVIPFLDEINAKRTSAAARG